MAYATFDVVVVPFPYSDQLAEKRRPAVVISSPQLEKHHGLVWLAMITSAANPAWTSDLEITSLKASGLPAPSRIRPAKIATVDVFRIVRRIGSLSTQDAKALKAKLKALLPN